MPLLPVQRRFVQEYVPLPLAAIDKAIGGISDKYNRGIERLDQIELMQRGARASLDPADIPAFDQVIGGRVDQIRNMANEPNFFMDMRRINRLATEAAGDLEVFKRSRQNMDVTREAIAKSNLTPQQKQESLALAMQRGGLRVGDNGELDLTSISNPRFFANDPNLTEKAIRLASQITVEDKAGFNLNTDLGLDVQTRIQKRTPERIAQTVREAFVGDPEVQAYLQDEAERYALRDPEGDPNTYIQGLIDNAINTAITSQQVNNVSQNASRFGSGSSSGSDYIFPILQQGNLPNPNAPSKAIGQDRTLKRERSELEIALQNATTNSERASIRKQLDNVMTRESRTRGILETAGERAGVSVDKVNQFEEGELIQTVDPWTGVPIMTSTDKSPLMHGRDQQLVVKELDKMNQEAASLLAQSLPIPPTNSKIRGIIQNAYDAGGATGSFTMHDYETGDLVPVSDSPSSIDVVSDIRLMPNEDGTYNVRVRGDNNQQYIMRVQPNLSQPIAFELYQAGVKTPEFISALSTLINPGDIGEIAYLPTGASMQVFQNGQNVLQDVNRELRLSKVSNDTYVLTDQQGNRVPVNIEGIDQPVVEMDIMTANQVIQSFRKRNGERR